MTRVVIVDDESEFREWLRSLLGNDADFNMIGEAGTGDEAVKIISELETDLVILDVFLPDWDGFEIVKYIQQHYPHIKTVLISAYNDTVYQRLTREVGGLTFIPKDSFNLNALYQVP